MMMEIKKIDKYTYEVPEEYTYLKAEILEMWTPRIIIAKNVSNMDIYKGEVIKIIVNGEDWLIDRHPWEYYLICYSVDPNSITIKRLESFIDMPFLNKEDFEFLLLVSLNDLKDKKRGDVIIQKYFGDDNIFSFCLKYVFYPEDVLNDFVRYYVDPLYNTIDTKEFPYLKIYVTLRCAEISFKFIRNKLYDVMRLHIPKMLELIPKINESLNKDRNIYIVNYFLAHFKEDFYLKKEFFDAKAILELYDTLEPIRFNDDLWTKPLKPPKDPYRDIQKLKRKIEKDLKNSLINKAIRSYQFSLK